jgi:hypothetical protein
MLRNPSGLAAIVKTHINVFAIQGTGDDPLRATGAVLLDLPSALERASGKGEVFWSRPRNPRPRFPWDLFRNAADHRHQQAADLYEEVKVSNDELRTPWRDVSN